jgi:hypothetical protein
MLIIAKEVDGEYRYGRCHEIELLDARDCGSGILGESFPNGNGYCLSEGEGTEMCAFLGKSDPPHRCKYFDGVVSRHSDREGMETWHSGSKVTISCLCQADF